MLILSDAKIGGSAVLARGNVVVAVRCGLMMIRG